MRRTARTICEEFAEKLRTDTNTLVSVPSRDRAMLRLGLALQAEGWRYLPIPASQSVPTPEDPRGYHGRWSHKKAAVLAGLGTVGTSGLFLHREEVNWKHIAAAVAVNCLVVSLCVTTFWLHILYGTPYHVLFVTRIVQNLIMIPIQFAVLRLLQKPVVLYCRWTRQIA